MKRDYLCLRINEFAITKVNYYLTVKYLIKILFIFVDICGMSVPIERHIFF